MAVFALVNALVHVHGYDLTGDSNSGKLTADVETLDGTTWGSGGWKAPVGGLKSVAFTLDGFVSNSAVDPDADLFPELGLVDRVHTVGPVNAEANPVYFWQGGKFNLDLFDKVGQLAPFSVSSMGTNGVGAVRGQLAKARGNVSAAGPLGSVVQLGAPGAGQFVYASFHVFTAGTTITVQVQSDDNAGMTTPVTRATIGPLTVPGGTFMTRVPGPFVGETFWRFNVSAITGTFNVAGAIAVQ